MRHLQGGGGGFVRRGRASPRRDTAGVRGRQAFGMLLRREGSRESRWLTRDVRPRPRGRAGRATGQRPRLWPVLSPARRPATALENYRETARSEEHTSELQSLMRISYAVFCLKKKKKQNKTTTN